jgi:hypothetical protein
MTRSLPFAAASLRGAVEKRRRWIVAGFFLALLLVGAASFRDYGIPWDEPYERMNAIHTVWYLFTGNAAVLDGPAKYHGPALELPLVLLEKLFGVTDLRRVFFMRHFVCFLIFWAGVLAFYRLAASRLRSWRLGLLGALFLALSPRVFADSFYNSKDIPCMVLFIVAAGTLLRYLDRKTMGRALVHAAACAVLIDVRIMGVVMPALTALFFVLDEATTSGHEERRKAWVSLGAYALVLAGLVWLFWPLLWRDPLVQFAEAFRQRKNFTFSSSVLYMGRYIRAYGLPWHYLSAWILISTPPLYVLLFAVGASSLPRGLSRGPARFYRENRDELVFAAWFFLPLAGEMVLRPSRYDAWRHFFFLYPAFLLIALRGWRALGEAIEATLPAARRAAARRLLAGAAAAALILTAGEMARLHPFENLYFNRLAGSSLGAIKNDFELDYWGLTYRRAFESILRSDARPKIRVALAAYPLGISNVFLLPRADRDRLVFVAEPDAGFSGPSTGFDYFASNYRWHREEYPAAAQPVYSISIDGARIIVVYKSGGA